MPQQTQPQKWLHIGDSVASQIRQNTKEAHQRRQNHFLITVNDIATFRDVKIGMRIINHMIKVRVIATVSLVIILFVYFCDVNGSTRENVAYL